MGSDTSKPLPPLSDDSYISITSWSTDTLILFYFKDKEVEAVRNAILANWKKGIASEEYLCEEDKKNPTNKNCLKIKMSGRPFATMGPLTSEKTGSEMRLMIAGILDALHANGWSVVVNSDMVEEFDTCFWLFQRGEADSSRCCSIALSAKNKIRVNDANREVLDDVKKVCEEHWKGGIRVEEDSAKERTVKIEFKEGTPWSTSNHEEVASSHLLVAELVKKMASHQYGLYSNTNFRGLTDTLYFKQDQVKEAEMASIQVLVPDTMLFIRFPESICATLSEVIQEYWPKGIQSSEVSGHSIKFNGRPFCRQMDTHTQDSIHARNMVTKMVKKLASVGYMVQAGLNLSRLEKEKTNFLFRKTKPVDADFMCLSANFEDRLQLMNAPVDVCEAVKNVVTTLWLKGESERELTSYPEISYQTKVKGTPWSMFNFADVLYGQALLLHVIVAIQSLGWKMVCSGDLLYKFDGQKHKGVYGTDIHAWWFMKQE